MLRLFILVIALFTLLQSINGDRNVWAIIASTSRYWFNYRHASNALSIYHLLKQSGLPDSRIILMLPDDWACNPRNAEHAGMMFSAHFPPSRHQTLNPTMNLYDDIEVDYRGSEAANVESFLRLMTGRHVDFTPKSQQLMSDESSSVLIYMSGHGGNGFIKWNDQEELSAVDIGLAIEEMAIAGRFNQLMMIVDTCQAESLHHDIEAPHTLSITASKVGQNSYSAGTDSLIGLALSDRFTAALLHYFIHQNPEWQTNNATVADLIRSFNPQSLNSNVMVRSDRFERPLTKTHLHEFFTSRSRVRTNRSRRRIAKRLTSVKPINAVSNEQPLQLVRSNSLIQLFADNKIS